MDYEYLDFLSKVLLIEWSSLEDEEAYSDLSSSCPDITI